MNKYRVKYVFIQCVAGGDRVVWRAYIGVIQYLFGQIPNLQSKQINTCRQVSVLVNFFKDKPTLKGLVSLWIFGPCVGPSVRYHMIYAVQDHLYEICCAGPPV